MATDIKTVLDNVKKIYMTDSVLESLIDYERVLDELDLYSFANWKTGELVEGPVYEKYFVTCKWMYKFREMPDPSGAERLLNYGCEVTYEKDTLEYPIRVKSPSDFKAGTKVPKLVSTPIWIVSITVPKRLMSDIQAGALELENDTLDIEDVQDAYEDGLDEIQGQQNEEL